MAKKVRFPLEMEDGIEVRSLEELKENFSLDRVLFYLLDGKLETWLRDRYEDGLADAVSVLDREDREIKRKLCDIFEMEYVSEEEEDPEKATERKRRQELLKEYTEDGHYMDVIDQIVFDQDELYDLLDEGEVVIYLCGERFSIPLGKEGIRYVGINTPTVVISSKEKIDFEKKGIFFENIRFDEKYQKILDEAESEAEEAEEAAGDETGKVKEYARWPEEIQPQMEQLTDELHSFICDFFYKVSEKYDEEYNEEYGGEGLYEEILEIDASDYGSYSYEHERLSQAKVACKAAIKRAVSDVQAGYAEQKKQMENKCKTFCGRVERDTWSFLDQFQASVEEYVSLYCDGEASIYAETLKTDLMDRKIIERQIFELDRELDVLVREVFDVPSEELWDVQKYFEQCDYDDEDDEQYCYLMEDAVSDLNDSVNSWYEQACGQMEKCMKELYLSVFDGIASELNVRMGHEIGMKLTEKYAEEAAQFKESMKSVSARLSEGIDKLFSRAFPDAKG